MLRLLLCMILFSGLMLSFVPATNAGLNFQDTNALVLKIRGRYLQINERLKNYRKVKKDANDFSAEGGEMTAYFSGKQLVKISAIFYGETHRTNVDYYFHEGKLIFIFQSRGNYKEPMSGKIVSTEEDRFYFNEDKLIKWQDGKKDKNVSDEESIEMEKSWLEDLKKLVEIANS